MRGYFFKRLLLVIPTLLGISIISFAIIHLAPGDPAELKLESDERVTGDIAQQLKETRELYGLDQPLYVQYARWLKPNSCKDRRQLYVTTVTAPR